MDDPKKKHDTSEYSSSKAPETEDQAENHTSKPDSRLLPGGPLGAPGSTGMSALDREQVPSEGRPDEKKGRD